MMHLVDTSFRIGPIWLEAGRESWPVQSKSQILANRIYLLEPCFEQGGTNVQPVTETYRQKSQETAGRMAQNYNLGTINVHAGLVLQQARQRTLCPFVRVQGIRHWPVEHRDRGAKPIIC